MGEKEKEVGVIVASQLVSSLIGLAFDVARRRGLTAEQTEKLYLQERLKFLENDPTKIPEV